VCILGGILYGGNGAIPTQSRSFEGQMKKEVSKRIASKPPSTFR
jgi:hypothetical protein